MTEIQWSQILLLMGYLSIQFSGEEEGEADGRI